MQARIWARGQTIANPDPRLAIYVKCKEWGVLPDSGGLFDQDPELMDAFDIISNEVAKVERQKQREQERKSKMKYRR